MGTKLHGAAGVIAMATILLFFSSTVAVELFGSEQQIAWVKDLIVWGLLLLVPALMATGISGNILARGRQAPLLAAKRRRMPLVAANGIVVLVPSALYLDHLASQGDFGTAFLAVQGVELVAGAVNLTLLAFNARDGFRIARARNAAAVPAGSA